MIGLVWRVARGAWCWGRTVADGLAPYAALVPEGPIRALARLHHSHDPHGDALRRAGRVAITQPLVFAIGHLLIGNTQVATFGAFGVFAFLLFAQFPGSRSTRLSSFTLLWVVGLVLIPLGTLASGSLVVATVGMTVVAFLVLFAGVLSAAAAGGSSAALLSFILAVSLSAGPAEIGGRLLGWTMAAVGATAAALLLWPPSYHNALRRRAADICTVLAVQVERALAGRPDQGDERAAMTALRQQFRSTSFRPVGLTTGDRAIGRLVDELEWLFGITRTIGRHELAGWPAAAREPIACCQRLLEQCAVALVAAPPTSTQVDALRARLVELERARTDLETVIKAELTADGGNRVPYELHEVGYTTYQVGTTVLWATEADARPYLARLMGRRPAGDLIAPLTPTRRVLEDHVALPSVWLRNSIRGAVGLGLAVLVAHLGDVPFSFWVVLGTLSVLRSNALATGANALRAVVGTALGFVVGGLLVYLVGTNLVVLWLLLPVAVFVAAYSPAAISFLVGQAAFTLLVLIMFNILQPAGWELGITRLRDVLLGCACSLVVGLLFWPRGAAGTVDRALADAYRVSADFVARSVGQVTYRGPLTAHDEQEVQAVARRLDDTLRQYFTERGPKPTEVATLTRLLGGANRLRLTGQAIERLRSGDPQIDSAGFAEANNLLSGRVAALLAWYSELGESLASGTTTARPAAAPSAASDQVYDALHDELRTACMLRHGQSHDIDHAVRLLWAGFYLCDLERLEGHLTPVVDDPVEALG